MSLFRIAQTECLDTRAAIREIHARTTTDDIAMLMFFCSNQYDQTILAEEISHLFPDVPVMGCTAAGGFGADAYGGAALSAVSFSRSACEVALAHAEDLSGFDETHAHALVQRLFHDMERRVPGFSPEQCFALQLIDGLSFSEELVTRLIQGELGKIPLIGGSAGDDMRFHETRVFCAGEFRSAVSIALVHTSLPFHPFMTQHFTPAEERLVVTEADAGRRIVRELNGYPAAKAYARSVGLSTGVPDATLFAEHPVVVAIGGQHYVRAIQRALPDDSLSFFCAIEEGVVLRIAHSTDLVANLAALFDTVHERVGPPALVLGFECVLRKLEAERSGVSTLIKGLLARNHAIGFCTYGEQYQGVHINQTLTGIAIGYPDGVVHDRAD